MHTCDIRKCLIPQMFFALFRQNLLSPIIRLIRYYMCVCVCVCVFACVRVLTSIPLAIGVL